MLNPVNRFRRNKKSEWIRDLVAENSLNISDLILPIFITEGVNQKIAIPTMPGVYRYSIDQAINYIKEAYSCGIKAIAIFPSIEREKKSSCASEAFNPDNLICRAVKEIKSKVDIGIICDVALDPYTLDGHDGIIIGSEVANDETVELLVKQALVQAQAGCDIIAPSDMMDGKVAAIRKALDHDGYQNVAIMSYAVKYASKLYGPFRDAVSSRTATYELNKLTYQLDYRNRNDAILKIKQDIAEGADMIIVKPGMLYLDILRDAANNFLTPLFAYQVSGEYAMLKFASMNGCFNYEQILIESLISFKRAGATGILTYAALDAARIIGK
jgi:porphobilinogen synthase